MENSRYKFRAWDKLRKLMFDIYDLGKEQSSSENGVTCPNSDLEIMQYTGLKDKNGKEIYESMEINNRYKVVYIAPEYVLQDISNNDIVSIEVVKNENGIKVTKEHTEI